MKRNGTRGAALADQFRVQASAVKPATAAVRLPIPDIAPDFVFEFEAKRIEMQSLLMAGALPESMARMILGIRTPDAAAKVEEAAQIEVEQMSVEEQFQLLEFQKKIAIEVCHEPKLVFRDPTADNEIDLRAVPFADRLIRALYAYAMGLSPAVPVATTEGKETTVADVETFSSGGQLFNTGADGTAVRAIAQ